MYSLVGLQLIEVFHNSRMELGVSREDTVKLILIQDVGSLGNYNNPIQPGLLLGVVLFIFVILLSYDNKVWIIITRTGFWSVSQQYSKLTSKISEGGGGTEGNGGGFSWGAPVNGMKSSALNTTPSTLLSSRMSLKLSSSASSSNWWLPDDRESSSLSDPSEF